MSFSHSRIFRFAFYFETAKFFPSLGSQCTLHVQLLKQLSLLVLTISPKRLLLRQSRNHMFSHYISRPSGERAQNSISGSVSAYYVLGTLPYPERNHSWSFLPPVSPLGPAHFCPQTCIFTVFWAYTYLNMFALSPYLDRIKALFPMSCTLCSGCLQQSSGILPLPNSPTECT